MPRRKSEAIEQRNKAAREQLVSRQREKRLAAAKKAWQFRKLLDEKEKGKPRWTPRSLAAHLGLAVDSVLTSLYYTEILEEIRQAIDDGVISLKLCVVGVDCVCYGFDAGGNRELLAPELQAEIFTQLLDAFGTSEVHDNAITRTIVAKIKALVLKDTRFGVITKSTRRQTIQMQAAEAAAKKLGLMVVDGVVVGEVKRRAQTSDEDRKQKEEARKAEALRETARKMEEERRAKEAAELAEAEKQLAELQRDIESRRQRVNVIVATASKTTSTAETTLPLATNPALPTEATVLRKLLKQHGGSFADAAKAIGVPRTSLRSRAEKLGVI